MLFKIKKEMESFSRWFRIIVFILGLVYLSLWIFSINLSYIQKDNGFEPLLPGAPEDSVGYILISESLINGNGLSQNGKIETLRGFAYPLFAAIIKTIGGSYFAVTLAQIILVFISAFIIRRIGIVFSGKNVGEIAATIFLVNPVTMTLSLLILTDVFFLFLFTLGFYLITTINDKNMFRKMCLVISLFILVIYVRGMGIFALPIFMAPILVTKLSFKLQTKLMAIVLVSLLLSTIPAIVRNYIRTGVANFNGFESVNLSWIVPKFIASVDNISEKLATESFQEATGVPKEAWDDLSAYDLQYASQISKVGEKIILEHPFSYIKFHLVSSVPFLFPSSILFMKDAYDKALKQPRSIKSSAINALASGDWKTFYISIKEVWWKFAERVCWLLALLLGVFAVWKGRRNVLVWVFVFISGYFMILSGPAAGPRLSFQAWPYMFILFASGGIQMFQKFIVWKEKFVKKKQL